MSRTLPHCLFFAVTLLFCNNIFAQCAANATGISPTTCGACDGNASVLATGGTGPYTYLWSTGETTSAIGGSQTGTPLCINAGGTAFLASNGNTFTDDQFSSGGTSFSNAIAIANTTDDAIFQDERFVGNGGFFSYNIPVTGGNYLVELYFAEIFFGTSPARPGGVGSRLFDVSIEGVLVLDDYDIFADAGGAGIAVIKSFNTNVTDGTLNILFDGVVNNAKINALCVTPVSSAGLCAGNYSVTITDALGCIASDIVTLSNGACDDANACTTDSCNNNQCVFTTLVCDDGDSCTADACVNGTCIYPSIPGCGVDPCENILCDDADPCTFDVCDNGNCVFTPLNCNDNDLCTTDSCLSTQCVYIPIDCNDNDPCTIDNCNNGCVSVPLDCEDNDACTTDACDNGTCIHPVIPGCNDPCSNVNCDDNNACTTDLCSNGQCIYSPLSCFDNDVCTTDTCVSGQCVNTEIDCEDNNACTTDACDNGICIHPVIPGCGDPCFGVNCDDNDACTTDLCSSGQCIHSTLNCDDNNTCTLDACDNGQCTNVLVGCCQTTADCNDNDICTNDACLSGVCNYTSPCDDGNLCTQDNCRVHSGDDDDDDDGHGDHDGDDDDDDGDDDDDDGHHNHHGNGNGYHCYHRDINCDDHNKCTTDECDNGVCVNTPKVCDDNDPCTVNSCENGRCKFNEQTCDDNNECTADNCNAGNCTNTPIADCCAADADCDDSDPCTNDKCFDRDCRHFSTTLAINETEDFCQDGSATLEPSETGTSYAWSTGATTFTIDGLPGVTYSVTVTQANGCVKTATITVSPREELLSSYVILAEEEIKLYRNTVYDGGIGVTDHHGDLKLKNQTMVTAAGTFAQADDVSISSGSQVTDLNTTEADVDLPEFETNPYCNNGGSNVNVQQNQTVTLSGSVFSGIYINRNATVTFTSPDLNIRSLHLKDNVTVHFANCTRVKICKYLKLGDDDNTFNPENYDVIVYVEDHAEIESGSTVNADIYVRDGELEVKGSTANNPTTLTGLFIAERVDAKDNVSWHANPSCDTSCGAVQQLAALKTSEPEISSETTNDIVSPLADKDNVYLKSYPNPFTDKLFIEFSLPQDAQVKLEVYSLTGQLLATLFEGNMTAGEVRKFEYSPATTAEGMFIYRLQTATDTYFGKAVMVR